MDRCPKCLALNDLITAVNHMAEMITLCRYCWIELGFEEMIITDRPPVRTELEQALARLKPTHAYRDPYADPENAGTYDG